MQTSTATVFPEYDNAPLSGGMIFRHAIPFQPIIYFDFGIKKNRMYRECVKYRFYQKQHGLAVITPFDLLRILDFTR